MIELSHDALQFSFPEVHPKARLSIDLQRTLRIPDDGRDYVLPPGLGRFPMRHVDDFPEKVPQRWLEHGGVMLPMYQAEALWLNFTAFWVDEHGVAYPFAIKVATGKIDAVTGESWSDGLHRRPQDYMVAPNQPWLDGYAVEKGVIRQFVAMPLGAGYSAEEQLTGEAEHGGIQIIVYPMKRKAFERRFPKRPPMPAGRPAGVPAAAAGPMAAAYDLGEAEDVFAGDMGLSPGGRMQQEIYDDPFSFDDWDLEHASRCFVHLCNSMVWRAISGEAPPTVPPTAKEYSKAGLPWFDYYGENETALPGAERLAKMKSVKEMGQQKGDVPLPENESVSPENVVELRRNLKKNQVREGTF